MKAERHAQILDIVSQQSIETQEELVEALHKRNFSVTQATVSRDIKELRLVKVLTEEGVYRYAAVTSADNKLTDRFVRMFSDSITSMQASGNLVVLRTLSGSANIAASIIDSLKHPDILGCVAGDDTILVIAKNAESVQNILRTFRDLQK